ncbi:ATP-binding protein [Mucilaginibacter sp.]|uniref:sensor histidine kinase n=1 Tax=Mucilaginibacter sp. TaxID=1882438 RepID=UPI002849DC6D|nr:ATP-binding protein [Mucilaginibacter sp.]MDR3696767.1 histidine kinase [Mucilaginibacter sp.]
MPDGSIPILVLSTAALFASIAGFIIYFIVLYRNRQLKNQQEQEHLQSIFRQEVLKARIEMQEQTLNHVSREIHDNITQVLSFVKLDLAMIGIADDKQKQIKINESRDLIAQAINDLKDLSKSLSFEHITKLGLLKTIEMEVNRLNKSGIVKAEITTDGEMAGLGEQRELVLFRIFQEAVNNMLKHAGATHFKISLQYYPELFNLTLEDDGIGFSDEVSGKGDGAGLRNMENRAALIGAIAKINSAPGKGCVIKVSLNPLQQQLYIDEDHSNSIG